MDLIRPNQVSSASSCRRPAASVPQPYALAIATDANHIPHLYAANFKGGTVDVFDGDFNKVSSSATFVVPKLPPGCAVQYRRYHFQRQDPNFCSVCHTKRSVWTGPQDR